MSASPACRPMLASRRHRGARRWHAAAALWIAALAIAGPLAAQPAPTSSAAAPPAGATAMPTGSVAAGKPAPMPPGHPPTDGSAAMPPGHPAAADSAAVPGLPPGHPDISGRGRMGPSGMMPSRPPADRITEDTELAARSLVVRIVDGNDDPIPKTPFVLHALRRSVTKGDESSQQQAVTDETGSYTFENLTTGRGVSYRLTVARGAAQFSSQPFGLSEQHGMRAVMHAFEPTSNPAEARVDVGAVVVIDLENDQLAVEHILRILVVGPKAWVAKDVSMALAEGHRAFHGTEAMGRASIEQHEDGKVGLSGTFPPGTTELSYGYRLPVGQAASRSFDVVLPSRVSRARVVAAAAPGMSLQVTGLPPAQAARGPEGKRLLMTETQIALGGQGLSRLTISLDGLPGPSPVRWVALLLAVVAALAGGSVAFGARARRARAKAVGEDLREAREVLLDELSELEDALRRDEISKAAYAPARAALVEAVARIMRRQDENKGNRKGKRS